MRRASLPSTAERIRARALELGFARVGIVPAGPVAGAPRFEAWLEDGFDGELEYMRDKVELRRDTRALEPWARSVIAVSAPYDAAPVDARFGRWSRYALSSDYHETLRGRLHDLAAFVRAESGAEVVARAASDSAPVLERSVGETAGLGWIAKSAMLIDQEIGPYTFLAELFVDVELAPALIMHPDRCGTCRRCLDGCPTGAIVAPFRVDARRCISYLTIEARGPIPRGLRPLIGDHLFGCDVCLELCPWSSRPARRPVPGLERREDLERSATSLLEIGTRPFARAYEGTPVARSGRKRLARNAAVVLGNLGDRGAISVLSRSLHFELTPLVRGHAAWALGRLGGGSARSVLDAAARCEPDAYVQEEIRFALEMCG